MITLVDARYNREQAAKLAVQYADADMPIKREFSTISEAENKPPDLNDPDCKIS